MNKLLSFLLLFVSLSATAQDDKLINDPNAKIRVISEPFTKISVSSGIELYLTQGNEIALAVSFTNEKYEERFKTEVKDGELKIYYDNEGISWTNDKKKLKAYLSYISLEKIKGTGGAKVMMNSELTANDFELKFSSGSQFKGKLQVNTLLVDLDSGAEINASGKASKIKASANSGAMFKGFDLEIEYGDVSANSGGAIKLQVQKELKASANSGGAVYYSGNATVLSMNTNSGGQVRKS